MANIYQVTMEDEYTIVVSENGKHLLVDNTSTEDSCVVNLHELTIEYAHIRELTHNKQWSNLIPELIECSYLD